MKIERSNRFKRHFRKRIENNPDLVALFKSAVEKFLENPLTPSLETHPLKGNLKGYWAFTVAYDCRVVFFFEDNNQIAVFHDIGRHHEVY
jgi:addiction module RelE/StbE family toxin